MKIVTNCFCLKDDQILLGMKKRGFGTGKWNGYGGKLDADETPRQAAVRELREESTLVIDEKDLEEVAVIDFYFGADHIFECHVFFVRTWKGEPTETDEMRPQWFKLSEIPYEKMWADDPHWLPDVLADTFSKNHKKLKAAGYFNADGSALERFEKTELK